MDTNDSAPLFVDIFLYSYEAELVQSLISIWKKVRISIQSHLQVYRVCIVRKQPKIRNISG